jgi:hypothetical protein
MSLRLAPESGGSLGARASRHVGAKGVAARGQGVRSFIACGAPPCPLPSARFQTHSPTRRDTRPPPRPAASQPPRMSRVWPSVASVRVARGVVSSLVSSVYVRLRSSVFKIVVAVQVADVNGIQRTIIPTPENQKVGGSTMPGDHIPLCKAAIRSFVWRIDCGVFRSHLSCGWKKLAITAQRRDAPHW